MRQAMLDEAVQIIRALFDGGYVTRRGRYFDVEGARLWDLPDRPPPIGVAVSGPDSCELAGRLADLVIAVEPDQALITGFAEHGGAGKPAVGQLPVCWDADRDTAVRRAHEQFRWFGGGWKVNAELPGTAGFAAASRFVRPEDVAESIPCGDRVDDFVEAVRPFVDAGFDEVALVQVGGDSQPAFLDWAEGTLLPALREAF